MSGMVPLPPCTIDRLDTGASVMPGAGTVSASVLVAEVTPAPDAVKVRVVAPVVAVAPTVMVAVEAVVPLGSEAGLKATVTPVLLELAAKVTAPV